MSCKGQKQFLTTVLTHDILFIVQRSKHLILKNSMQRISDIFLNALNVKQKTKTKKMTERCSEIDKYPPAVIKVGTQQPHGMCSQQLVFFSPHFVFSSFPSWTGSCLEQWGFSGSFSSCSGRTSHTAGETRWPHFYFTEKIRIVCCFCKETHETQLGR